MLDRRDSILLDSSGNFPRSYSSPLSIIGVHPEQILKGHISNPQELLSVMESYQEKNSDLGYPKGGLAGWIDYDGSYTFGLYPNFLVYNHSSASWISGEGMLDFPSYQVSQLVSEISGWRASMSQEEFIVAVNRAKDFIAEGDIYQVNLAQKFSTQVSEKSDLFSLYQKLRYESPAPMACYGQLGGRELLCSSPETFMRMSGNVVETRPIKGTSPRFLDTEKDQLSAHQLVSSAKENAELVMITDLLRNDLGMVCEYGSVKVDELLSLERLEHVYHLVSTVRGQIRKDLCHLDVLKACLPGGSITGAPKIRAMEVIKELETVPRGLYTGVVGYLGFNGESQFNVVIRSMIREGKELSYHVGAGIVADSNAQREYEETLMKAKGIRRALNSYQELSY